MPRSGRRVQEQLRKWGKIDPSRSVPLQEGERAYPGDRIIARENTAIPAGGPGAGPLLNGDVLLVEGIAWVMVAPSWSAVSTGTGTGGPRDWASRLPWTAAIWPRTRIWAMPGPGTPSRA